MGKLKKVVVVPDSFKGSLSSEQVCRAVEDGISIVFPECSFVSLPVADGGEGSVDCFCQALGGKKVKVQAENPYFEMMESYYGACEDFAVIEMAACAGLPLVKGRENASLTTTFGVGALVLRALEDGYKKIVMCIGGSATNDAGCGMAAALGVRFYNEKEEAFIPVGGTLKDVCRIDLSGLDSRARDTEFVTMCDIDNPLFGANGAAYIFGPQKGANPEMVKLLDAGLVHLAKRIKLDLGLDVAQIPGAGAAGGMGAGMVAFLSSKLQMGIDTVLEMTKFSELAKDADLVVTGEGRLDSQSLSGKVAVGVGRAAKALRVPVVVIAGALAPKLEGIYDTGITAAFDTTTAPMTLEEAMQLGERNVGRIAENVARLIEAF